MRPESAITIHPVKRIRLWYALIVFVGAAFIIRAFYLQVIRHDYYQKAALSGQLKQYEIPARRGVIKAHSGGEVLPLVLNEKRYTLFADPKYVKDIKGTAVAIAGTLGGNAEDYESKLKVEDGVRYAVLMKKLTKDQKAKIDKAREEDSDKAKTQKGYVQLWKGVGAREIEVRTYPQGTLAAQVLGFVNDDGEGNYGIEGVLNDQLKGKPGELKAITDASGVPLVANKDNVVKEPQSGSDVILTIDLGMQQQLEDILKTGLEQAKSKSGQAFILEVNTGAVKAMANYPTYNPGEFFKVEDGSVFNNGTVFAPLEVGSIMKPLTYAAAKDLGKVNKESTYHDPGGYNIDNTPIKNVEGENEVGTRSVRDILQMSLNTGATWLLMQMGGGEVNKTARLAWHEYMTNHYLFGKKTGIEQASEATGSVPDPLEGYGLNIQYANTAFGQGVSTTMLQVGAAYAAVLNGGTYYKPRLIDQITDANGKMTPKKPEVIKANVVKPETSQDVRELMEYVVSKNYQLYKVSKPRAEFMIGGKTGTAQIHRPAEEGGGYYPDRFNGTFVGFVGGNQPQYVVLVRVDNPNVTFYAGAAAAAPIFGRLSDMLINNSYVTPRN